MASIGAMAYFDEKAEFTQCLRKLTQSRQVLGSCLTFHNRDFYGLQLYSEKYLRGTKQYWAMENAHQIFYNFPAQTFGTYLNFRPLDFLACRFGFDGRLMFCLDRLFASLLGWFKKGYFFSNFIVWGRSPR